MHDDKRLAGDVANNSRRNLARSRILMAVGKKQTWKKNFMAV